jgi:DNA-directed RNA polymerase subunit RPC12/RpoP
MKIKNPPADVVRVVFLIDGNPIGEDVQAPFSLQFNTDSYSLGVHALSALGYTSTGEERTSNVIQPEFVPASAAGGVMTKILVPIIGLVVLLILVSAIGPMILNKGKLSSLAPGTARKYGIGGGVICPKCARPFPLRLWWINLGWNKIDRCPYCGKWVFVRPRSMSELRQAEAAELVNSQAGNVTTPESETDRLHKDLDDSKYHDI